MTDTHNGYKNYETFSIAVVIINDQEMLKKYQRMIEGLDDIDAHNAVKAYIEASNPLIEENTFYNCLLNSALENVDWLEIVESIRPENEDEIENLNRHTPR